MTQQFEPPGPGTWTLDTTHSAAAFTRYSQECFTGLARGFQECCGRYGLLMDRLQPGFVNGFFYVQQVGVVGKPDAGPPPKLLFQLMCRIHPELRRRVRTAHEAFTGRLWLQDLADWDVMKQDSIARNTALQSVDVEALDDEEFVQYLQTCRDNAEEMIYRHHKYSVGSIMPVGWFIDVATRGSGLAPAQVMPLLKGSTPVSVGIGGEQLAQLAEVIKAAGLAEVATAGGEAELVLERLCADPAVRAALDAYLMQCGHMLIGGYCISEKTLCESPNIILARIQDALRPRPATEYDAALEAGIRARIPAADREEFEEALANARQANRMRDERGVYNDIWGAGIARRAVLEAGRRLQRRGVLPAASLALDATHGELMNLLQGRPGITVAELEAHRDWRLNTPIDSVPEMLGTAPQEPPPLDWLPEKIHPTMRAFIAVMGNVFDSPEPAAEEVIAGLPVSPGVYEGTARVILNTQEFGRLQQGDVLVTKNTSAGFNVVLPILGALVTDRGGLLSHAAIVSREYGIPGVVGTKNGTLRIKDGDRIRVDGDSGEVTILS